MLSLSFNPLASPLQETRTNSSVATTTASRSTFSSAVATSECGGSGGPGGEFLSEVGGGGESACGRPRRNAAGHRLADVLGVVKGLGDRGGEKGKDCWAPALSASSSLSGKRTGASLLRFFCPSRMRAVSLDFGWRGRSKQILRYSQNGPFRQLTTPPRPVDAPGEHASPDRALRWGFPQVRWVSSSASVCPFVG